PGRSGQPLRPWRSRLSLRSRLAGGAVVPGRPRRSIGADQPEGTDIDLGFLLRAESDPDVESAVLPLAQDPGDLRARLTRTHHRRDERDRQTGSDRRLAQAVHVAPRGAPSD